LLKFATAWRRLTADGIDAAGGAQLHWRDENDKRRRQITEAIADVPLQQYFSQARP
jgi:hypothetical protein